MEEPIIGSPEWLVQQKQKAQKSNLDTAPIGYNPSMGIITSSIFTPTPSITPAIPKVSPPSGIPQIQTPQLTTTPKEQEASDLTKRLQDLQDTLAGKPAFKKQEEKQFDIAGKTQLVHDLTAQYQDLLAQSKNIPERLQLDIKGREVTSGGLEPIQTGELRKLSIASNTIAAQLQAAQGNFQFAQSLVDKAVSDQYAPQEAELDAKTKNLKLIIDSSEYSIQDKNRAQAQADAIENQKNAIADEKQNKKDVLTEVNNAIKNGLTDSNIIAMMKGQKLGADAALIAAEAGFGQPKLKTGATARFEDLYGRKPTPQEYFDFVKREKGAATTLLQTVLKQEQLKSLQLREKGTVAMTVNRILTQMFPAGKSPIQLYNLSSQAINRVQASLKILTDPKTPNKGAADLDLIDAYVQIARGGQQITEAQVDALLQGLGVKAKFDVTSQKIIGTALLDGGTRKEIGRLANKIFEGQKNLANLAVKRINERLKKIGIPEENLFDNVEDVSSAMEIDTTGQNVDLQTEADNMGIDPSQLSEDQMQELIDSGLISNPSNQ